MIFHYMHIVECVCTHKHLYTVCKHTVDYRAKIHDTVLKKRGYLKRHFYNSTHQPYMLSLRIQHYMTSKYLMQTNLFCSYFSSTVFPSLWSSFQLISLRLWWEKTKLIVDNIIRMKGKLSCSNSNGCRIFSALEVMFLFGLFPVHNWLLTTL